MPKIVYDLDNAITGFFSAAEMSTTRAQCDDFARRKFGGQIQAVDFQGMTSYTVIAGPNGDEIVQFREQSAILDMDMMRIAKDVHGDFVPRCSQLGWLGHPDSSPLAVYGMNKLPGVNYITARSSFIGNERLQLNTVHSLAMFFAQSWRKGTTADPSRVNISAIRNECYARIEYLLGILPKRFTSAATEVREVLPTLLTGAYPMVLTHSDLNAMNILVDPNSGDITGIIDWPGTSILPFGFALYALENALGIMGPRGWQWFDNADYLRDEFWRVFRQLAGPLSTSEERLIRLAGKAGILIRYGTAYDSGFTGMIGVRDPGADDFGFLEALL